MKREILIIFTFMIIMISFIIPVNAIKEPINLTSSFNMNIESGLNYKEFNLISRDDNLLVLIQQLSEEIYLRYLENLTAIGPRYTTTSECEEAGQYIYNEFKNLNLDTRYQYWDDGTIFGNNIEATIHGSDPSSDKIYIICAHYDTVLVSPGADDDGSGIVLVLSAAYIMRNERFGDTIRFVAFSGEEQGLKGSEYYVQEAVQKNDNIIAVLNADMIGFAIDENDASTLKIYDGGEQFNSTWITENMTSINEEYNEIFNLEILPAGSSGGSDHAKFWNAGYNAIFAHEYNFNDYYHSPDDTIENMNIDYAIRNSKLIIATLAELSRYITSNSPPFKPNKPSGPLEGKINIEYNYSTTTIDPNGEQLYYLFDWGDGTDSGWVGPFTSSEIAISKHIWTKKGNYEIKVKAKNVNGFESEWSNSLSVNLPKNRITIFTLLYNLIQKIISSLKLIKNYNI